MDLEAWGNEMGFEMGLITDPNDPFLTCSKQELETTTGAGGTGGSDKATVLMMATELLRIIPFKLSKEHQQKINNQFQSMSNEEMLECWFRLCPFQLTHRQVDDMKGWTLSKEDRESPVTPLTAPSADSNKGFAPIGPESNVSFTNKEAGQTASHGSQGRRCGQNRRKGSGGTAVGNLAGKGGPGKRNRPPC